MRLIPAIDIIEGKCVRLTKGDYSTQKIYSEDPLEIAMAFEDHGIENLHLVDLDGAKAQKIINYKVLERIATKTNLNIDFGGGLKTNEDLEIAFNSGAKQITGGSIAVNNPDLFLEWLDKYGSNKIILGADVKNGKIATSGWTETSDIEIENFIKNFSEEGIKYVISTDISKDGMLQGPSLQLYKQILDINPELKVIASGGVSQLSDLENVMQIGCEAVIIGKAIYENKINLKDLENFILNN
ncbi:1-(5-phosphoribosyl)-5-[(5-phosphoribosylamino)methylideneamino]imidazole-4-carboxamide isomerase [Psychroflexus sp. S27]|uniref:1-(5-phosphoribosyl)-5-[(5- phosphoribosylamino)methylideneamino]imidazole-4- carboxamide isomerase n=1 Tax=Psychroflexus sp. S27 TaxID=1982757 RepID=UPI000C2ADB05|nr:1-(5-phosphoribosyl)-5-[(5-phosphoribosylamino)methylideneamino]imidazole-4-carboxamide isomerase [Psychroflexus sp. S27]PJX28550.1 1-(5-phosphoribosyl)-5-[(5-phosphoribosylamino)methylideneamino]imidazole-4-carboxamide isomerase [Psychroflexus sp. S27]